MGWAQGSPVINFFSSSKLEDHGATRQEVERHVHTAVLQVNTAIILNPQLSVCRTYTYVCKRHNYLNTQDENGEMLLIAL